MVQRWKNWKMCQTRWASRLESFKALDEHYQHVLTFFDIIAKDDSDQKSKNKANGHLLVTKQFVSLFSICLLHKVFALTDVLNKLLQTEKADIAWAQDKAAVTIEQLKSINNEKEFSTFYLNVISKASNCQIARPELPNALLQQQQQQPHSSSDSTSTATAIHEYGLPIVTTRSGAKRSRVSVNDHASASAVHDKNKRQRQNEEEEEINETELANQKEFLFYFHLYKSLVQKFIDEIEIRFDKKSIEPILTIYEMLIASEVMNINEDEGNNNYDDKVNTLTSKLEIYKKFVNLEELKNELPLFYSLKSSKKLNSFSRVIDWFTEQDLRSSNLIQIRTLIEIYLSIPISSATSERSFSALRRIETWLRTTTGQQRLSEMAIIHIEKKAVHNIDIDTVIDRFNSIRKRLNKFL